MQLKNRDSQHLSELLHCVLENNEIWSFEEQLLQSAMTQVEQGVDTMRIVSDLKKNLAIPAIHNRLSKPVQEFYGELQRVFPSTGAASTWNFMMKSTSRSTKDR